MITWDKNYELGIPLIDDQHKELVNIIGELSDLLVGANGEDIFDEMVVIIENLKEYTIYHFQTEEALFERLNYSNKVAHEAEHNKLVGELEAIDLDAIDGDQIVFGKKLLNTLISWLFKHISGSDFLYKDLFLQNLDALEE